MKPISLSRPCSWVATELWIILLGCILLLFFSSQIKASADTFSDAAHRTNDHSAESSINEASNLTLHDAVTVSYTHLDVYKRQTFSMGNPNFFAVD